MTAPGIKRVLGRLLRERGSKATDTSLRLWKAIMDCEVLLTPEVTELLCRAALEHPEPVVRRRLADAILSGVLEEEDQQDFIERLLEDSSAAVRKEAVSRCRRAETLRRVLESDPSPEVRKEAAQRYCSACRDDLEALLDVLRCFPDVRSVVCDYLYDHLPRYREHLDRDFIYRILEETPSPQIAALLGALGDRRAFAFVSEDTYHFQRLVVGYAWATGSAHLVLKHARHAWSPPVFWNVPERSELRRAIEIVRLCR